MYSSRSPTSAAPILAMPLATCRRSAASMRDILEKSPDTGMLRPPAVSSKRHKATSPAGRRPRAAKRRERRCCRLRPESPSKRPISVLKRPEQGRGQISRTSRRGCRRGEGRRPFQVEAQADSERMQHFGRREPTRTCHAVHNVNLLPQRWCELMLCRPHVR